MFDKVSIVLPCYREEKNIIKTLESVLKVLKKTVDEFEIICVVDGLVDNTFEKVKSFQKKHRKTIKIIGYQKNRGKGFAVRVGFDKANGDYIGFIDADGQINASAINNSIDVFRKHRANVVIGSKRHAKSSVDYTVFRKLISSLSRLYIRLLFGVNVSDTQAGIKIFNNKLAKKIVKAGVIDRFAFDIEMLVIALKEKNIKIKEIPIDVRKIPGDNNLLNTLNLVVDGFKSFLESMKIFYLLKFTHYYNDESKNVWTGIKKTNLKLLN